MVILHDSVLKYLGKVMKAIGALIWPFVEESGAVDVDVEISLTCDVGL
jgi:hypothetical protein